MKLPGKVLFSGVLLMLASHSVFCQETSEKTLSKIYVEELQRNEIIIFPFFPIIINQKTGNDFVIYEGVNVLTEAELLGILGLQEEAKKLNRNRSRNFRIVVGGSLCVAATAFGVGMLIAEIVDSVSFTQGWTAGITFGVGNLIGAPLLIGGLLTPELGLSLSQAKELADSYNKSISFR